MNVCTCGRAFTHCRFCGSKNLYKQKIRSMNKTIELGRVVEIHSCKKCGADTDDTVVCRAPSFEMRTSAMTFEEPSRPPLGTDEYLEASKLRLNELLFTKLTIEQAVTKMQSEGWVISMEEPKAQVEVQTQPEIVETSLPEITLDDVLSKMREQATKDANSNKTIDLAKVMENMRKKP